MGKLEGWGSMAVRERVWVLAWQRRSAARSSRLPLQLEPKHAAMLRHACFGLSVRRGAREAGSACVMGCSKTACEVTGLGAGPRLPALNHAAPCLLARDGPLVSPSFWKRVAAQGGARGFLCGPQAGTAGVGHMGSRQPAGPAACTTQEQQQSRALAPPLCSLVVQLLAAVRPAGRQPEAPGAPDGYAVRKSAWDRGTAAAGTPRRCPHGRCPWCGRWAWELLHARRLCGGGWCKAQTAHEVRDQGAWLTGTGGGDGSRLLGRKLVSGHPVWVGP